MCQMRYVANLFEILLLIPLKGLACISICLYIIYKQGCMYIFLRKYLIARDNLLLVSYLVKNNGKKN